MSATSLKVIAICIVKQNNNNGCIGVPQFRFLASTIFYVAELVTTQTDRSMTLSSIISTSAMALCHAIVCSIRIC